MKRTMLGLLALLALGAGYELIYPTSSKADDLQKAGQQVQSTQQQIAQTVAEAKRIGEAIETNKLKTSDDRELLSSQLTEMDKTKREIGHLAETLDKDLTAFEAARAQRWASYQEHIAAITSDDPMMARRWEKRGESWHDRSGKVLSDGKAVVAETGDIITHAGDLEHIAACLKIEGEMISTTADIEASVMQVRASAGSFSTRANQLLARITESTGRGASTD
jgi:hypothetical protein